MVATMNMEEMSIEFALIVCLPIAILKREMLAMFRPTITNISNAQTNAVIIGRFAHKIKNIWQENKMSKSSTSLCWLEGKRCSGVMAFPAATTD